MINPWSKRLNLPWDACHGLSQTFEQAQGNRAAKQPNPDDADSFHGRRSLTLQGGQC
jgi:hypothetical protein